MKQRVFKNFFCLSNRLNFHKHPLHLTIHQCDKFFISFNSSMWIQQIQCTAFSWCIQAELFKHFFGNDCWKKSTLKKVNTRLPLLFCSHRGFSTRIDTREIYGFHRYLESKKRFSLYVKWGKKRLQLPQNSSAFIVRIGQIYELFIA